jgi:hypothetical protein
MLSSSATVAAAQPVAQLQVFAIGLGGDGAWCCPTRKGSQTRWHVRPADRLAGTAHIRAPEGGLDVGTQCADEIAS